MPSAMRWRRPTRSRFQILKSMCNRPAALSIRCTRLSKGRWMRGSRWRTNPTRPSADTWARISGRSRDCGESRYPGDTNPSGGWPAYHHSQRRRSSRATLEHHSHFVDLGHVSRRRCDSAIARAVDGERATQSDGLQRSVSHLLDGTLDALFVTGSYPIERVSAAMHGGSRLVPLASSAVARVIEDFPFFRPVLIPSGTYPGLASIVHTIGVETLLVCRADLDDGLVYELTRKLFRFSGGLQRRPDSCSG